MGRCLFSNVLNSGSLKSIDFFSTAIFVVHQNSNLDRNDVNTV